MRLSLIIFLFQCSLVYSQSAAEYDSIQDALKNATNDSLRYEINLAQGYKFLGDEPDSARGYLLSSLQLSSSLNSPERRARTLTLIGLTYYFEGQHSNALSYYLRALPISDSLRNDRYTGIISNNIGAVYFELKDLDRTSRYYEDAIGYFRIVQDTFWLSNVLNNLGNVMEKRNNYERALEVYQECFSLAEASENIEAKGAALSNIGNVHAAKEQLDSAYFFYENGLAFQKEDGDEIGEAISLNNLGQILTKKQEYEKAIQFHSEALDLAIEVKNLETIKNSHRRLSYAYEGAKNYYQAYEHQSIWMTLQDSLTGIEKSQMIEELTQQYEAEKKDKQITELNLEKKTAALNLAESKNLRNLLITILIVVVILTILLYVLFRQKKESLRERETLLREIHHRVKNNLQVISSLLNLQAESLENKAAANAVKEGQNRVKSMALIHEKLYKETDLKGINIEEYLENLVSELFNSFGIDNQKIQYDLVTNNIKMDIDTVIPLGLILTELITNSLKYAFAKDQNGKIVIMLKVENNKLIVLVKDDGVGFDQINQETNNSFGWKIIRSLSRKLKAQISVNSQAGTEVKLEIEKYKLLS